MSASNVLRKRSIDVEGNQIRVFVEYGNVCSKHRYS